MSLGLKGIDAEYGLTEATVIEQGYEVSFKTNEEWNRDYASLYNKCIMGFFYYN